MGIQEIKRVSSCNVYELILCISMCVRVNGTERICDASHLFTPIINIITSNTTSNNNNSLDITVTIKPVIIEILLRCMIL